MRLTITGSHSTGKTTLLERVAERVGDTVVVTREVARELIRQGVPLNDEVTADSVVAYITAQIARDRNASGHHVLSDRSLLDLLAYIEASSAQRVPAHYVDLLRELVLFESRIFDYYIYVPVEFALEHDDVRPADTAFQKRVDDTVVRLLQDLKLPTLRVSGTLDSRVEAVVALLQRQHQRELASDIQIRGVASPR